MREPSSRRSGCWRRWRPNRHPSSAARWPNSCEAGSRSTNAEAPMPPFSCSSAARRLEPFDAKSRSRRASRGVGGCRLGERSRTGEISCTHAALGGSGTPERSPEPFEPPTCSSMRSRSGSPTATRLPRRRCTRALAAVHDLDLGADDVEQHRCGWPETDSPASSPSRPGTSKLASPWRNNRRRSPAESGALVQLQFVLNFVANNVVLTGDLRTRVGADRRRAAVVDHDRGAHRSATAACSWRRSAAIAAQALPMIAATIDAATQDGSGRTVGLRALRECDPLQRARTPCGRARSRPASRRR